MKEPALEPGLSDRVNALLAADKLAEALRQLDEALARNPRDREALRFRGLLGALKKDWKGMIADLSALLALEPDAGFDGALAGAYANSGDLEAALAECDRELRLSPSEVLLLSKRSDIRNRAGDLEGARADLEQAANLNSTGYYWAELAYLELEKGLRKEAIGHLEKAMAASPGDWRLRLLRAKLHLEDREYQKAHGCLDSVEYDIVGLEACRGALEETYVARAYARLFLGQPDVEDDVRAALGLNPENSEALTLRGLLRFRRGEEGAREDLETAVRLDPDSYLAHATLGQYWQAKGEQDKAREHLRKADELNRT